MVCMKFIYLFLSWYFVSVDWIEMNWNWVASHWLKTRWIIDAGGWCSECHRGDERAPRLQSVPIPSAWNKWLWGDRAWPLSRARVTLTRHTASPVSRPGPSLSAARLCLAQTASDPAQALTVWALCTMPVGRLEWGQHLQEPRFRLLTANYILTS